MPKVLFSDVPTGTEFFSGNDYLRKVQEDNVNAIPVGIMDSGEGYMFEDSEEVFVFGNSIG